MKRAVVVGLLVGCLASSTVVRAEEHGGKEHAGKEHGGTTISEPAPPGLSQQGKTPKGLEKQGKTPAGWTRGKKTGWSKSGETPKRPKR